VNVLHVAPSFYPALVYGGPIRALHDLCLGLSALGEDVRALTTDADGTRHRLDVVRGCDVTIDGRYRVRYCRRVAAHTISPELLVALPGYVRWADVVHVTALYSFPILPALLVARSLGRPVVISPRGSLGRWGRTRRRVAKSAVDRAVKLLGGPRITFHVTSEAESADVRAVMGEVAVAVIPNGVNEREFRDRRGDAGAWLRNAASLKPDDGPIIGCLGRLHRKKALDRLVGAVPVLRAQWPRLHAVIAGPDDGEEQARLEAEARARGVTDRVHFLGPIYDDRAAFLAGLDVFVLPSEDENFGNVIAEALAAGTPVVASRSCPWPELVEHRCGRWIEATTDQVATAVSALLSEGAHEAGLRGREFVLRARTARQTAVAMRDLYRSVAR
jgi:glycosyltransferase involved in cell wall biosynthesis